MPKRQVEIEWLNDDNVHVGIRPVLSEDQIAALIKFVEALQEEDD
jgi:hypothetical protein